MEMNKEERGLEPTGTEVIFGSEDWDFFFKFPFSIAYADIFPIVASLPPKNNNKKIIKIFFGGREATTGNTSAVRRLHKKVCIARNLTRAANFQSLSKFANADYRACLLNGRRHGNKTKHNKIMHKVM